MRQYRGRRKDNGEWVYGWYVKDWEGGSHIVTEFGPDITHCWDCGANEQKSFKVDPETVGQFTGLKDKNGKEIYEGDVLINPKGIRGEIKYVPEYAAFLAYWKHDGECGYDYLDKGILMKCEVIGNIYENQELLKGDENE